MSFRYVFAKYLKDPQSCPGLLFEDENVLIIEDMYPKSLVHYLIIPKENTSKTPQEAFKDEQFIAKIQKYVDKASEMVLSKWSASYETPISKQNIIVCCHSVPSLANLHIHVMTDDLCSNRLKNKKHYNSFATPFAIKWTEFPLAADDPRHSPEHCNLLLKGDLIHNGINYRSSFRRLRQELDRKRDTIVTNRKRRAAQDEESGRKKANTLTSPPH
ncbi:hypothetical protein OGAPHI_002393 [Ogataea philodendri]|uniref:HIT domain-containing protein n=1 Tax=Ogataea philodendri TaxID=1378263 RepID=A0A9P8PCB3_9ASCO|nr:uncharacterized protein OGAPHI_002393 [Ogataea philodendri]KAH3668639.1 hypothetical protein OGAPHI_002393 [Ogataea philodendri]